MDCGWRGAGLIPLLRVVRCGGTAPKRGDFPVYHVVKKPKHPISAPLGVAVRMAWMAGLRHRLSERMDRRTARFPPRKDRPGHPAGPRALAAFAEQPSRVKFRKSRKKELATSDTWHASGTLSESPRGASQRLPAEQVGMGSRSVQTKFLAVHGVEQQPVGFDVAIANPLPLAGKHVVSMPGVQMGGADGVTR